MSNLQTFWLRTASPQGIAALAAQGRVDTLRSGRDETFEVRRFFLLRSNEATQDARFS